MNKYQEALDDLKKHIIGIPILSWYYKKDTDTIQELVDRATPKKPIKLDKGYYRINGGWKERITDCCPNCTQQLRYKRCCDDNECRQAIDWSNNED